jgi:hypothetical protein
MAWVDADVTFQRPDWAQETIQKLRQNKVVQMFSHCMDISDQYHPIGDARGGEYLPGFIYQWSQTLRWGQYEGYDLGYGSSASETITFEEDILGVAEGYGNYGATLEVDIEIAGKKKLHPGHCGYAWAIRRDAYDELGGLLDFSPCGANDHHMAAAFIGNILKSVNPKCHPDFLRELKVWGARAEAHIKPYISYVDGLLIHHFHGDKSNRRYIDRWKILVENQFNPRAHLKQDAQGLYRFTHETPRQLISDLRAYFAQRNEDHPHLPR